MKLKLLGMGMLASVTLAGCFESEIKSNADSDGNCATAFVEDYIKTENALKEMENEGTQALDLTQKRDLVSKAKSSCLALTEKYQAKDCLGFKPNENQILKMKASDFAERCAAIPREEEIKSSEPLVSNPPSGNSETPAIEKPQDSSLVAQFEEKQIYLDVLNASSLVKAGTAPAVLIYKGKLGSRVMFSEPFRNGEVLCAVTFIVSNHSMVNGSELTVLERSEKAAAVESRRSRKISFTLSDEKTGIGCLKLDPKPFTLGEIRSAFKGLFEIRVKP